MKSFYSKLVRLKVCLLEKNVLRSIHPCFYSKLVRLKGTTGISDVNSALFLFQTGAIKREVIKGVQASLTYKFLFQTGAIKSFCKFVSVNDSDIHRCFYSKLVRLKAASEK